MTYQVDGANTTVIQTGTGTVGNSINGLNYGNYFNKNGFLIRGFMSNTVKSLGADPVESIGAIDIDGHLADVSYQEKVIGTSNLSIQNYTAGTHTAMFLLRNNLNAGISVGAEVVRGSIGYAVTVGTLTSMEYDLCVISSLGVVTVIGQILSETTGTSYPQLKVFSFTPHVTSLGDKIAIRATLSTASANLGVNFGLGGFTSVGSGSFGASIPLFGTANTNNGALFISAE